MTESKYLFKSRLGDFLLTFRDSCLIRLEAANQADDLPLLEDCPADHARAAFSWLRSYFYGEQPQPDKLRFQATGTAFQQRVWALLLDIPYGYCMTYGFMARMIAPDTRKRRLLSRAVGQALSKNPIWIIIPCHRVICNDGSLGGYAGGSALKYALLRHEGVNLRE